MMVTPSVKLVRPLGEGGMGSVWVADHLALSTQVVVKFISDDLRASPEAHARFKREAAAAAQVKSPHVVQTFDHGVTTDGIPYIVMELLEGRDLGQVLDETPKLAPELVLEIVVQLSRALDRAHEKGIVHRDIKPGNIFLCESGSGEIFVKLLDFGIAKGMDVPKIDSNTKTGAMIGSPFYMSPEQILGSKDVDKRSDLWSVGIVAFEALTGTKPFDAETMGGLAIKIHSEPLPSVSTLVPTLPASVDAWFLRACSRDIAERFASAKEMAETLAAALGGQMPRSFVAPRISTGSSDVSARAPTLVAGATTDAGVVRPSTMPSSTRSRLLVLVGLVAVLGVGSFVALRTLLPKKPEAHALVPTEPVPTTPTVIQADRSAAATGPTSATPGAPPSAASAVAAVASDGPPVVVRPAGHAAQPRAKDSGHTVGRPLPSQAAPLTTAPPAPSGRDIF